MNHLPRPIAAALCSWTLFAGAVAAQMEKRAEELYDRRQFLAAAPAVDSLAPDLVLTDLDGRPQALSAWRGRIVVVIKAGFT